METPNTSFIEQLEAAASVVPPNVEDARVAISGIAGQVATESGDARLTLIERTAGALDAIAGATDDPEIHTEFTAFAATYQTFAGVLGGGARVQREATRTAGKDLSGGKQ